VRGRFNATLGIPEDSIFRFATGFSRWLDLEKCFEPALAGLFLLKGEVRLKPAEDFVDGLTIG